MVFTAAFVPGTCAKRLRATALGCPTILSRKLAPFLCCQLVCCTPANAPDQQLRYLLPYSMHLAHDICCSLLHHGACCLQRSKLSACTLLLRQLHCSAQCTLSWHMFNFIRCMCSHFMLQNMSRFRVRACCLRARTLSKCLPACASVHALSVSPWRLLQCDPA